MKWKTVSVLVPEPLYDSIQQLADELGVRKSDVMRKALALAIHKVGDAIRKEQKEMTI